MSEELFRGKREDNGEWVYGNHLYDDITGKHFIVPFGNITESTKVSEEGCCYCVGFEVIPETVGRCIGLSDKNGNKIFDGDIVKEFYENEECEYDYEHYDIGRVFWYQHTLRFLRTSKTSYDICPSIVEHGEYEVIGNIHDNPELLEVTK